MSLLRSILLVIVLEGKMKKIVLKGFFVCFIYSTIITLQIKNANKMRLKLFSQ